MLARVQQLLVEALRHPDPHAFLQASVVADEQLTEDERQWLLAADGDGLRLSRLLVRKLRLQRLLRGDADAQRQLEHDPATFAERFAAYDRELPPTAVFPADEAASFNAR